MKNLIATLGLVLWSLMGWAQSGPGPVQRDTDATVVLDRYKEFLLFGGEGKTTGGVPRQWLRINADGRWSDLQYADAGTGVWFVAEHLLRARSLAIFWANPTLPFYHSPAIKTTILLALDHWAAKRYKNSNWWHNEIGIPQIARDILILMRDSLPAVQFKNTLSILAQYRLSGTGANLVWSADLGLHYGALTSDAALMKLCRDTIVRAIKISVDEGIEPDYSFHQHGRRLQIYHYGSAFLTDNVRIAWQLRGLGLAFPAEKIQILTDFVLKGWQWMARGINTVPGTVDRAVSRPNALRGTDLRRLLPLLRAIEPDSALAFDRMRRVQDGTAALNGYRYFPYSDFTAYQRPGFSFFLKTASTRTLLTESINHENLKGELLDGGDGYFIRNGKEYYNLAPLWDWSALPGITNVDGETRGNVAGGGKPEEEMKGRIIRNDFVGGVSDGVNGLSVMDYTLERGGRELRARKFWACYKDVVVGLVAGETSSSVGGPAFTVMDQCRWQGDVAVSGMGTFVREGRYGFGPAGWVWHNGFVYMSLGKDSVDVQLKQVKGRWMDINLSEPGDTLRDKLFMARVLHPAGTIASGYVVGYAATPSIGGQMAARPCWRVLRNDTLAQAVCFDDTTLMVAVYRAGGLDLPGGPKTGTARRLKMGVDRACLLLWTDGQMYISDPGHSGGQFTGTINGQPFSAVVPSDGTTVLLNQIIVHQ